MVLMVTLFCRRRLALSYVAVSHKVLRESRNLSLSLSLSGGKTLIMYKSNEKKQSSKPLSLNSLSISLSPITITSLSSLSLSPTAREKGVDTIPYHTSSSSSTVCTACLSPCPFPSQFHTIFLSSSSQIKRNPFPQIRSFQLGLSPFSIWYTNHAFLHPVSNHLLVSLLTAHLCF